LRQSGPVADENRFQFSTKRKERTVGVDLFEYRVRRADVGWLSRDPIAERGGINLFEFVGSNPVDQFDTDGQLTIRLPVIGPINIHLPTLPTQIPWPSIPTDIHWPSFPDDIHWPTSPSIPVRPRLPRPRLPVLTRSTSLCGCGPDITEALDSTLQDVDRAFDKWDEQTQINSCMSLYIPPRAIFNEWDMEPLFTEGYPMSGEAECARTYTVKGSCFWAGSINYALWGRVNKICHNKLSARRPPPYNNLWGLGMALGAANINKGLQGGISVLSGGSVVDAAKYLVTADLMTTYGYTGYLPPSLGMGPACSASTATKSKHLEWQWLPGKSF
jgi:RHS repeat-associated protein